MAPVAANTVAKTGTDATATESSAAAGPAGPEAGRTATAGDEPPHGRPNKPLLAAAAIAGTVLIGVPFLFLGPGADDDPPARADRAQPVGGTFLQDGDPAAAPTGGGYAPASPSATPEKSTPEATPEEKVEPVVQPQVTVTATAKAPPASPSSSSPSPEKKKAVPAEPKAATGRVLPQGANFSTVTKVMLKNVMTGLCADVPGYGKGTVNGEVHQFTCNRTGDNQLWDLVVAQNGAGPAGADLFLIRNSTDGYCMDVGGYGAVSSRTPVSEFHCNGTTADNQLFYLDKKSDGKFWIRNHASANRCLDVAGYNGVGGKAARLTLFDCALTDDHLWSFS
ncbi:RICIN domain-containing protein [Streptomyces sp. CRN 30]|uniref:RICIN domain-containing protein n=1 Tax=Streptomyces sp. CRN 30 TaxID=3075613 RepID=UPI002A83DC7E|nr:RICIN domain-containing protein [Streptomyces sp. CRN 30]